MLISVLLVVIGCITAAGQSTSGAAALPDDSLQSSEGIKQAIRDFAASSGESVTAEDIVNFLDQNIQQAPAAGDGASGDIGFGPEYVFNSARTYEISAAALSSTKFVVAYQDEGNSDYGTAVIGDVSGIAITFGSEYVFNSDDTSYISAAALSSSKFVVAYQHRFVSLYYGKAVVGDVSGTAITFGSEYVFNSAVTYEISAAALSSSKFVVAYLDGGNSGYGTAVIGDVSGTAITFGSEYVFNSVLTSEISAAALSSSEFVVAYQDVGNSGYGTAVIGDVSGTAITFGSEYVFNSAETWYISAVGLSSSKFVVAYEDRGNSSYGTAVVGDVSGNAISFGLEYVFSLGPTYFISAAGLSSSEFVVAYYYSTTGSAVIGDVSGTAITFGSEYVFNSGSAFDISAAGLSSSEFVVAYQDYGNVERGTAVIGGPPVPPSVTTNTATGVTNDSAILNGTLDAFGTTSSVDVSFQWATDDYYSSHGNTYDNETSPETMTGTGSFSAGISSLDSGTTYHFRAKAVGDGNDYGSDETFKTQHTLTVSSTTGGEVTTPGEGIFQYDYNDVVPIIAVANALYHFVEWTGTAVDAGKVADPCAASTTVTIHGNYTLIANFAIDQRTLTVSSTAGGEVSAPGEGTFYYDYGTVEPIIAEPNVGYHFVEWTGTAVDAGKVADANAVSTTVTMHGNYTLVANFVRTIYIDANAAGANDGWNWADAYNNLQDGLAEAGYGYIILVAEGTYKPDQGGGQDPNDREATFQLINSVGIYGGFPSGGGSWEQRDPNAHETILSGDIGTVDVLSDNSYHVVTGSYTDPNAVLDGFTITAGNANGAGSYGFGGGMSNAFGSPTVTNCTFSGNWANNDGGGMDNFNNGSPTLTNCTFSGNEAGDDGGGMCNYGSNPTIINCTITGNSANDYGGGMCNENSSNPTVTNCTFSGNLAVNSGGGMYNYDSNPTVTNCILWGNTDSGGSDESAQIHNVSSTPVVNYCCVQGWGGGGTGNISDDPLFVDPPDNLRLSWDSNCIDAGDNNSVPADILDLDNDGNTVEPIPFDLDGNPRILNGIVDMGAYECWSPIFVDSNAPGANDGSSWENAYKYLQDALVDASSNPDVNEIWVAEGTYEPDANSTYPGGTNDREATFQLINGVAIYGGFPIGGGNWVSRDPEAYETILSGDLDGNDVQGLDPCDLLDHPSRAENSYHVVTGSGTEPNAILDGFTITAGDANSTYPYDRGGGMYNDNGSPTVTNCIFKENAAGVGGGGGIHSRQNSRPIVANCIFIGNSASGVNADGGGMYNWESSPTVTNCTFSDNTASSGGGGMYNYVFSSPTLTNCTFSGNSAGEWGGGMWNYGSDPNIINCTFTGNSADDGGGMDNYYSNPTVTNCILWGNMDSGGSDESAQIHNVSSTPVVNYCCVQGWGGGGTGNISDDPLFVDPPDNLRLSWDSNCIDAGDNNSVPADILDLDNDGNTVEPIPFDLDSRNRFADGDCNGTDIVDMGAYEFDWVYIGDFAGGCDVDFFDFSVLGLTWMLEEGEAGYDPNCDISIPADKYIDWWDVDIFGKNWLAGK